MVKHVPVPDSCGVFVDGRGQAALMEMNGVGRYRAGPQDQWGSSGTPRRDSSSPAPLGPPYGKVGPGLTEL